VLSGTQDDGSAGLIAVKEQGGIAIIQDPDDAIYPGMPTNAMEALEENVALLERMADRMRNRKQEELAGRYAKRAHRADQQAEVIRQQLLSREANGPIEPEPDAID
jgi:two-component system, chemotaxis family, protein-glutamate methylesterase/glutaminase